VLGLFLGSASLWLGIAEGSIALWGFGGACLLQMPLALRVLERLRNGLGNRGLDRERRTLRVISHLLRFLALGVALASVAALLRHQSPEASFFTIGLAILAVALQGSLWNAKRTLAEVHLTLAFDAARSRALLEIAVLLLMGTLLGRWVPWADAVTGLALSLRLFLKGAALGKGTSLQAACGGCGSGCGCG
jgi:hypothetical protein